MISKAIRHSTLAGSIVLLCACTTVEQAPTSLLSQADASIAQAESLGAPEYAPVALNDAREHLRKARDAMDKEHYQEARLSLEKAIVDAEYAAIKANAQEAQLAAREITRNLELLQQEGQAQTGNY